MLSFCADKTRHHKISFPHIYSQSDLLPGVTVSAFTLSQLLHSWITTTASLLYAAHQLAVEAVTHEAAVGGAVTRNAYKILVGQPEVRIKIKPIFDQSNDKLFYSDPDDATGMKRVTLTHARTHASWSLSDNTLKAPCGLGWVRHRQFS